MQSDSKSTHRESIIHFSTSLFSVTFKSDGLLSKLGAPIEPTSTFMNKIPSFGLLCFGCSILYEICDVTLKNTQIKFHNKD